MNVHFGPFLSLLARGLVYDSCRNLKIACFVCLVGVCELRAESESSRSVLHGRKNYVRTTNAPIFLHHILLESLDHTSKNAQNNDKEYVYYVENIKLNVSTEVSTVLNRDM